MPIQKLLTVLFLGISIIPVSVASSADSPGHLEGLDDHVIAAMQTMQLPGLALAIVDESGIVITRGYGVQKIDSSARVDDKTLFEIGSITKTFTATAIGVLVERGDISWATRVREHIPYFELDNPYVSDAFTLADALSHRGGYVDSYFYDYSNDMGRAELIRRLKFEKPVKPFRTGFEYHNAIFATAAEVIPVLTGESWVSFIKDRIFKPLGMDSTLVTPDSLEGRDNVATPHVLKMNGMESFSRNIDAGDPIPEAGSIISNAQDMARWCQFQIGGEAPGESIPVSRETLAQMQTQYTIGTFSWFGKWGYGNVRAGYGLGWMLFDYRGDEDQLVAHGGSMDGIQAWMVYSPKNKYCIAMMSNGDWSGDPVHFAIANWIQDRYLGLAGKDWIADLLLSERDAMAQRVQRRASEKGKNNEIPFSQSISEYVGGYTNPSYGELTVVQQGPKLKIRLGSYQAVAEHWRGEMFFLDWAQPGDSNAHIIFDVSPTGEVTGLSLDWAGDVFDFSRIPGDL